MRRPKFAAAIAAMTLMAGVGTPALAGAAGDAGRARPCTIAGTSGRDVLVGTPAGDVICGGAGRDRLRGGGGADVLRGGVGKDLLDGGAGDDTLDGGPGTDQVQGGAGDDDCTYAPDDRLDGCVFDHRAPRVESVTPSLSEIDVTDAAQVVTLRVHLTDDTDVSGAWNPYVFVGDPDLEGSWTRQLDLRLATGTVRDGTWTTSISIPRGHPVADLVADVHVRDVVGHHDDLRTGTLVHVADADPDVVLPRVRMLSPRTGSTYRVPGSDGVLVARARITDAQSGVASGVQMCLARLDPRRGRLSESGCRPAMRVSGTVHDGIWRVALPLAADAVTGDACVSVIATDRVHPGATGRGYVCRDRYASAGDSFAARLLQGQDGAFTVRGATADAAPALTAYSHQVVSDQGPVDFSVSATDDRGIAGVRVWLAELDPQGRVSRIAPTSLHLTSGTAQDGEWTGLTPSYVEGPGTCRPIVEIWDKGHLRSYAGASISPGLVQPSLPLPGDPQITLGG